MNFNRSYPLGGCDPVGIRTRDPLLKRQLLYLLSYGIIWGCKDRYYVKKCKISDVFSPGYCLLPFLALFCRHLTGMHAR